MKKNKYPVSLSDAWLEACSRLLDLCEESHRDTDNVTLWDAFKLLYLERVPSDDCQYCGRRAKGCLKD